MTSQAPITIREMIDRTADYFQQKGIESPRLDAQLLIAHALGKTRLELYLQFDYPVNEAELARARELVRRRAAREPVAYIVGAKEFAGREFKIAPGVLIPRPDTEILVEEVTSELAARHGGAGNSAKQKDQDLEGVSFSDESPASAELPSTEGCPIPDSLPIPKGSQRLAGGKERSDATSGMTSPTVSIPEGSQSSKRENNPLPPLRVLEFGIGSGAIAVTLAANDARIHVTATEISPVAAEIARENASRHAVVERVEISQQPDFDGIAGEFDAIVSNPPYIDIAEKDELAPEVAQHEPAEALFADDAGLRWYKFLAGEARARLAPRGFIAVEIGYKQRLAVEEIFEGAGLRVIRSTKDYAGHYRVVMAERA